jgi:phage shock protein PspC (stress-responsive transcriptional regulator)
MNRRLYRSRRDSILGGVAAGVADYFDMDPSIVRIAWAILALVTGGIFLVLYIVMWIVVPEGPSAATVAQTATTDPAAPPAEPGAEAAAADALPPAGGASAPAWEAQEQRLRRGGSGGAVIFGVILVGLGIWFLIDQYVPAINSDLLWPVALVVLGIVLLVIALRRPAAQ